MPFLCFRACAEVHHQGASYASKHKSIFFFYLRSSQVDFIKDYDHKEKILNLNSLHFNYCVCYSKWILFNRKLLLKTGWFFFKRFTFCPEKKYIMQNQLSCVGGSTRWSDVNLNCSICGLTEFRCDTETVNVSLFLAVRFPSLSIRGVGLSKKRHLSVRFCTSDFELCHKIDHLMVLRSIGEWKWEQV